MNSRLLHMKKLTPKQSVPDPTLKDTRRISIPLETNRGSFGFNLERATDLFSLNLNFHYRGFQFGVQWIANSVTFDVVWYQSVPLRFLYHTVTSGEIGGRQSNPSKLMNWKDYAGLQEWKLHRKRQMPILSELPVGKLNFRTNSVFGVINCWKSEHDTTISSIETPKHQQLEPPSPTPLPSLHPKQLRENFLPQGATLAAIALVCEGKAPLMKP